MPTIALENVSVTYDVKKEKVVALNNLCGTLLSGAFNVIVGYSGCGKTTLLKVLAGLIDYNGKILFDDVDISNVDTNKRNISMVSQQYILYPTMTVFDNIAFPLKMKKLSSQDIQKKVLSVAKTLNLSVCLTRKPRQLSGGQQQRVAIARALVKNPSICLLDEPLSNVDAHLRAEERSLIKNALKESDCTVIYVTHDIVEAMALADNLIVMDNGKIEIAGSPLDVFNSGNSVVETLKEGTMLPSFGD